MPEEVAVLICGLGYGKVLQHLKVSLMLEELE
jgi:hypothetical protein